MALSLVDALARAGADPSVRVVIVRGRGRAFSAGGDVKQMAEDAADGRPTAYFDRPLAAIHTRALGLTKRQLNASAGQTFEAQLAAEQRLQQTLAADSGDAIEGVRAIVERRGPRFEGR